MFSRLVPALGVTLGVALVSVRAPAADTTPVRIAIDTPEGCASVRSFFDAVRARTDRIHLATRPREGLELRVSVVRVLQDKVRGELRVIDEQGGSSTRNVEGTMCEEVVRALSLTAALVLDQLVPPVADATASTPRGAAGAPAASSANAPGSASPGGEPARGGASSPEAKSQPRREREGEREGDDQDDQESGEEDASESTPFVDPDLYDESPAPPYDFQVDAGAAGIVGEIISPRVSVGGALFVTVSDTSERVFSPAFGVAIAHVPAEFAQSGGDVSVRWTAAIVSACPLRLRAGDLSFHPCAFGTGGFLNARGETSDIPKTASRSWWSAGALGRIGAAIGGGTSVRIELGLSVPFYRRRFVTTPPAEIVGESPNLSVLGALGVAHVF